MLYFQAQSLTNRANDLTTRKSNIDQGVSSLTTATQGVQSAIAILQQLQGLLQSAKTQTATQRASASSQFNTLAVQLNQLLNDSSYQGLNLVNSNTTNLTLQFSEASASTLKVGGTNLLFSALLAGKAYSHYTGFTKGTTHSSGSGFSAFYKISSAGFSKGSTFVSKGSNHSKGSGFSHSAVAYKGTGFSTLALSKYQVIAYTAGKYSAGTGHSSGSGYSAETLKSYLGLAGTAGHSSGSGYSVQRQIASVKASVAATSFAGFNSRRQ